MDQKMTPEQLIEIESQLNCPDGERGIEIGNNMNTSNISMTIDSIKSLNITDNNSLLEIGHGNCGHLSKILTEANNIIYYGLEISETMQNEAKQINSHLLDQNKIEFHLYQGETIPFTDEMFDKIMTVNTIYFWKNALDFLNEVYRVLKPNGIFVIAFAQKQFMGKLPFVNQKFELFDNQDIKNLINKTEFELIKIIDRTEQVKSKAGDLVQRDFSIIEIKRG